MALDTTDVYGHAITGTGPDVWGGAGGSGYTTTYSDYRYQPQTLSYEVLAQQQRLADVKRELEEQQRRIMEVNQLRYGRWYEPEAKPEVVEMVMEPPSDKAREYVKVEDDVPYKQNVEVKTEGAFRVVIEDEAEDLTEKMVEALYNFAGADNGWTEYMGYERERDRPRWCKCRYISDKKYDEELSREGFDNGRFEFDKQAAKSHGLPQEKLDELEGHTKACATRALKKMIKCQKRRYNK